MNQQKSASLSAAFRVIVSLFFIWGFITCLNDILIPHFKTDFQLSYAQAMLVQTAFFGAYFIISLVYFYLSTTSGDPIARAGYQKGLAWGLAGAGLGCALFYPAAVWHSYGLFLSALFVLASGVTLIQIAANPYVAISGPAETAPSRLNLAQGLNSLGYVLAPVVGGTLIFGNHLSGVESVKIPYLALAGAFFALTLIFSLIRLPAYAAEQTTVRTNVLSAYPDFKYGMAAIFCYVGAEVAVGSILVNYLGLPDVMGFDHDTAGKFLSFYWGGAMIGRFLGAIALNGKNNKALYMAAVALGSTALIYIASSRNWFTGAQTLALGDVVPYLALVGLNYLAFTFGKFKAGEMISYFSIFIIALLLTTMLGAGQTAMWAIIGIGLFNSVMWSNIFTLSIAGLGKDTAQGSSLLIMMIVGGALIPPLQGWIADLTGVRASFILIILCYAYLIYFGFTQKNRIAATKAV